MLTGDSHYQAYLDIRVGCAVCVSLNLIAHERPRELLVLNARECDGCGKEG